MGRLINSMKSQMLYAILGHFRHASHYRVPFYYKFPISGNSLFNSDIQYFTLCYGHS